MLHANKHHMAFQSVVGRAKPAIFKSIFWDCDDLINKIQCKGTGWTKEKNSESQQCQKLKFGSDGGEGAHQLLSRGDSG